MNFRSGGIERIFIDLALFFRDRGFRVDFVVCEDRGSLRGLLPSDIHVVVLDRGNFFVSRFYFFRIARSLGVSLFRSFLVFLGLSYITRSFFYFRSFSRYLELSRPDVVLSGVIGVTIMGLWGRYVSCFSPRMFVSKHVHLSSFLSGFGRLYDRLWLRDVLGRSYDLADGIIAVSDMTGDDLSFCTGISRDRICRIYNPVIVPHRRDLIEAPCPHDWIGGGVPVILSVGRLVYQKDYVTLLRSFSLLRMRRAVRLIILGDIGGYFYYTYLLFLCRWLGISSDVDFAGFSSNPYCYMRGASVFALSSRFEGLPTVLIESLYCGCPIVSTDCPSGPSEILDGGKYGRLVGVGDVSGFARALDEVLDAPVDRSFLQSRAENFSSEMIMPQYGQLLFSDNNGNGF